MTASLLWNDLLAWAVQICIVVACSAAALFVARPGRAAARLVWWQGVLALCVLLPLLQPWHSPVLHVTIDTEARAQTSAIPAVRLSAASAFPTAELLLWLVVGGVVLRLLWIAVGCARVTLYRRRAVPVPGGDGVFESPHVANPVTFGIFKPVVLVPPPFFQQPRDVQQAVLCHEFVHIDRRDALWTLIEECAGALLWFHPAVWWLLARIRLTREQAVDEEVVRLLGTRDVYVQALLAAAGAPMQFDVAPAPLFLRRRHLFHRVTALMEVRQMSMRRVIAALSASAAVLLLAAVLAVRTFPLEAAPQVQAMQGSSTFTAETPFDVIRVDTGSVPLAYPPRAVYSPAARSKRVEGTVFLQLRIGENGEVIDAVVNSGPDELRAVSLQSALLWRFGKDATGKTVHASVDYRLREPDAMRLAKPGVTGSVSGAVSSGVSGGVAGGVIGGIVGSRSVTPSSPMAASPARIEIAPGFSEAVRSVLEPKLRPFEGQALTSDVTRRILETVASVTPAARVRIADDGKVLVAQTDEPVMRVESAGPLAGTSRQVRIGGAVQATKLTNYTSPEYPPLARQARIQGTVRFNVVINKDGTVASMTLAGGHPLLVPAAQESVRQYIYQPTLLNGEPVEVVTTVDVNFILPAE
ncbi:MAG TPA: M56 family metallopeptidase [Bryobacteraceae bacterium]|nr:M56 family metallopeptidase [Bryobacteraceae bacterium]